MSPALRHASIIGSVTRTPASRRPLSMSRKPPAFSSRIGVMWNSAWSAPGAISFILEKAAWAKVVAELRPGINGERSTDRDSGRPIPRASVGPIVASFTANGPTNQAPSRNWPKIGAFRKPSTNAAAIFGALSAAAATSLGRIRTKRSAVRSHSRTRARGLQTLELVERSEQAPLGRCLIARG